ncbi:MAG: hypothetical protein Q8R83_02985 [Legionellaceae bacterium]|nr:hypothetical protein [Legionellaceae bacterium]
MENGTNRILAYLLATAVNDDDLDQIAGGTALISTRHRVRLTGGTAPNADVAYDVVTDF